MRSTALSTRSERLRYRGAMVADDFDAEALDGKLETERQRLIVTLPRIADRLEAMAPEGHDRAADADLQAGDRAHPPSGRRPPRHAREATLVAYAEEKRETFPETVLRFDRN